jgi:hypothetical protein
MSQTWRRRFFQFPITRDTSFGIKGISVDICFSRTALLDRTVLELCIKKKDGTNQQKYSFLKISENLPKQQ